MDVKTWMPNKMMTNNGCQQNRCQTMDAKKMDTYHGCQQIDAKQWMPNNGCQHMDAKKWMANNGCQNIDAKKCMRRGLSKNLKHVFSKTNSRRALGRN